MKQDPRNIEKEELVLPDDIKLYPLLMANNDEAWRDFCNYYRAMLRNYFSNHQVSTIEDQSDLVQDTFSAFFRTLLTGKYSPHRGKLSQWLYGIAKKMLERHLKRYAQDYSKQDELGDDDHPVEDDKRASETSLSDTDKERINAALTQLSEKLRTVVLLRISRSSEWTWKDIANELGISENAAKMRYSRGIAELKILLP